MTEPVSPGIPLRDASDALFGQIVTMAGEVFAVGASAIRPDLTFGMIDAWDSIGHINLMLEIEARFKVDIPPEAIAELLSLTKIHAWLRERRQ